MNANQLSEHGYDPVIVSVGMEWLVQYARLLRREPELIHKLAERAEEFELIPIPKVLLNRLAAPGILGAGNLSDFSLALQQLLKLDPTISHEPAGRDQPSRDLAFGRIREFAAAIEAGDLAGASNLFSPTFVNQDGYSVAEVQAILEHLVEHTCDRRFQILSIHETHGSSTEVVTKVDAIWGAANYHDGSADSVTEPVCLEVILEWQPEGDWKISGLRSV